MSVSGTTVLYSFRTRIVSWPRTYRPCVSLTRAPNELGAALRRDAVAYIASCFKRNMAAALSGLLAEV